MNPKTKMNYVLEKNYEFLYWISTAFQNLERKMSNNAMSLTYCACATIFGYINSLHAKFMVKKYSPFQISQIVLAFNAVLSSYVGLVDGSIRFSVKNPRKFRFLICRNFLSVVGQLVCFYYLSQYIPLSLINVIYGFTPIICFVLECLIYSAKIHLKEIVGSVFSFIGIILVIDIFELGVENEHSGKTNESVGFERVKYSFFCLLGCCGFGFANVIMKELADVKLMVIHFNWSCLGGILAAITMIISPINFVAIELWDWIAILIFNGLFNFIFMLGFTRAMQLGKKGRVAVVNNLQLFYSFLVEIIFFDEPPTWVRLLGSVLLVGGVMGTVL